jgi:hypothetical protein
MQSPEIEGRDEVNSQWKDNQRDERVIYLIRKAFLKEKLLISTYIKRACSPNQSACFQMFIAIKMSYYSVISSVKSD